MKKGDFSGMAVASFMLVVFSVFGGFLVSFLRSDFLTIFVIIFLLCLGVILGIFALIQIKKNKRLRGKLLAWVGVILGILELIIGIVLTIPIYR